MKDDFSGRIDFHGDIKPLLVSVCQDYGLGDYCNHEFITIGYEDLNLILKSNKSHYFVKIFADFRRDGDCQDYIDKITKVIEAGVKHPKMFSAPRGYLYQKEIEGYKFRLSIMEYIDGINFYECKLAPDENEKRFLVQQAVLINSINLRPNFIYDSWATVNFLKEYEKSKKCLDEEALSVIEPLANRFKSLILKNLPHCFVHGDLIKTNIIKDKNGKLYIIDFAVSNYYPRIVELAVLLCNVLFDEKNPSGKENYQLVVNEYQKKIKLTEVELKTLPLFTEIAHAMHVIRGTYEREVNNNNSEENNYWINLGRAGLGLISK